MVLSNLTVSILFSLNYDIAFIKYFPLLHLNEFLIGMCAGLTYLKGINKKALLFFFGSLIFLFFYLPLIPEYNTIHHDGLLAPIFALLILGASKLKTIILSSKPLIKLGNTSYGIYILQFPIYLIIYKLYNDLNIFNFLGEEGRFYIYLMILILISYLSSITFEKWMKNIFLKQLRKV